MDIKGKFKKIFDRDLKVYMFFVLWVLCMAEIKGIPWEVAGGEYQSAGISALIAIWGTILLKPWQFWRRLVQEEKATSR